MTGTVRLGVIMLCHKDLNLAARLARVWVEGGARVAIHVDARADETPLRRAFAGRDDVLFVPQRKCGWGRFSLVMATQDAAERLLRRWPDCSHVLLASGSCLPLRPLAELRDFLAARPDRDYIESVSVQDADWIVDGLNEERFTLYHPFGWQERRRLFDRSVQLQRRWGVRRQMPEGLRAHLGSQWWCLTTATLRAILTDPRRKEFDRFFRHVWIPDESYFQTLARRHSARIESLSLTLTHFDHRGRPCLLYDDMADMLAQSHCFVARKLWPGAEGLLRRFPQTTTPVAPAQPSPARIDGYFRDVLRRRRQGRPGIYMQSRFPRKDAENGKTSGPYVMFHGLADVFPDFRAWLAGHVTGQVHGHLFAEREVQFADGGATGPGALSDSVALRDHDPRGFLAALIRHAGDLPMFQFSPRDNQALNWFMATDPNARLVVVTGAWLAPLAASDMPFDDVRRIAARLHRTERDHMAVLESVWLRAQLQRWDLTDLLARPAAILTSALRRADPDAAPVTALPPMRDLSGLPGLLRRLRNSGLDLRRPDDLSIFAPPPPEKGDPRDDA